MSFARQRATTRRSVSSLRDLRPADARAWFCIAIKDDSDAELNSPALQAKVAGGAANSPSEVVANASARMAGRRRRLPARARTCRAAARLRVIEPRCSTTAPEP